MTGPYKLLMHSHFLSNRIGLSGQFIINYLQWMIRNSCCDVTIHILFLPCYSFFHTSQVVLLMGCHGRVVQCIGFVFWRLSRQNVDSNPGCDHCLCPWARHLTVIASPYDNPVMGGVNSWGSKPVIDRHPIKGNINILNRFNSNETRDQHQPDEPMWFKTDFTLF